MSEITTKVYEASLEVEPGSRTVIACISSATPDRDNEVVSPRGLKKKNYAGNPVVMLNHNYEQLPIGKCLWLKATDDKILAKYRVSDATQTARDVWGLLQDGTLNAHSIGFLSQHASRPTTAEINQNPNLKGVKLIHRAFEIMEFSVVGIPANPDALVMSVAKGACSPDTLKFLNWSIAKEGTANAVIEQAIKEVAKPTEKELSEAIYEAALAMSISINLDKAVEQAMKRINR